MKIKIIIQVFKDNQKLKNIPFKIGFDNPYLYAYHVETLYREASGFKS